MQKNISTKALIQYTVYALLFASIGLVTFILPAEYNIDPTGLGEKLGLTKLSPENNAVNTNTFASASNQKEDTITVVVPAHRGVEYKFSMEQYQKLTYKWHSNHIAVYHDLHGEPKGDTTGYFESYVIATTNEMEGSFTAPFTGSHGWYWKNTTDDPITIELTTSGQYLIEGLKQ